MPVEAEVTREGAQPSAAGDKPQGGNPKADDKVTLTRAEVDALHRERDEARESEKFWAQRARAGGGADRGEHAEEEQEQIETADLVPEVTGDADIDEKIFSDPDKWAEAISKGPAAIQAFIRKAGYVTGAEVADIAAKVARRSIDVERQKMGSDAQIVRDFPELQDAKSELFTATAVELKKLVAMDPRAKNSPSTLYAAASTAKAKLEAKRPPARRADPDDDGDRYDRVDREPEEDRRRRADAQDGTRSRGRDADADLDMLGPEARDVIKQMGITQEQFAESAREVRGQRGRGRR
jgi:hypothetical protein